VKCAVNASVLMGFSLTSPINIHTMFPFSPQHPLCLPGLDRFHDVPLQLRQLIPVYRHLIGVHDSEPSLGFCSMPPWWPVLVYFVYVLSLNRQQIKTKYVVVWNQYAQYTWMSWT